ncbi:hypothetical protein EC396_08830 [Lutibacter sp. HS1-25]|uniref:DUF5676 family membrane protein n=1 Tax=Lutibacter sp. HS1-25 TaxID=2485000 RepID=UPI0010134C52|nr:DUF5676 family membrane protein [Lutibacter sp. HS1-25]RXP54808.1 hypothetical protein EC396_08830 [Lutibacter sp. HS1-25]
MKQFNVKKMGIACGLTGVLLYLGCIILMFSVGQKGTIAFFNNLLHGLDTTSIIKMDVSLLDAGLGLIQTFILFWLIGASIAAFYNALTGIPEKK